MSRIRASDRRQGPSLPERVRPLSPKTTNVVPIHVSMGTYNAMQQSDAHSYWEFNYLGTNCGHPLYELPFNGWIPGQFRPGRRYLSRRRDRRAAVDRSRLGACGYPKRPQGVR
jgi:hypothetical protein